MKFPKMQGLSAASLIEKRKKFLIIFLDISGIYAIIQKLVRDHTISHGGIAQLGAQTVQQRTPQQQVHIGLCVNLQHLGV